MNHSTIQPASQGLVGVVGRNTTYGLADGQDKLSNRALGASVGPMEAQQQQPVVPRELDRLHGAVSELSACFADHRQRLAPVLLSSPPSGDTAKVGSAVEDLGGIGSSIRQVTLMVEAMYWELSELRKRLTI